MKKRFVPKKVTIFRSSEPDEKVILRDLQRGTSLETRPITSEWRGGAQDEGYEYRLPVRALSGHTDLTGNAYDVLQKWAEDNEQVYAIVDGQDESIYWYESVTISQFARSESGGVVGISFVLSIQSRRPRVSFSEGMAMREDTGFFPVIGFEAAAPTKFWVSGVRVTPDEQSTVFEYVDGTREKEFIRLHLNFEVRADALESISTGFEKKLHELLNEFKDKKVRFYPFYEKDDTVFYDVLMPDPPELYEYVEGGIEKRGMRMNLVTSNPLSSYPAWIDTGRAKEIKEIKQNPTYSTESGESYAIYSVTTGPTMMDTGDYVYVACADIDTEAGTYNRGVLRRDKSAGTSSFAGVEELDLIDHHFAPAVHARKGLKTICAAGWWGGAGDASLQQDYIAYYLSANDNDINFGSEKRLYFEEVLSELSYNEITPSYPNIARTAGKMIVIVRPGQSSSDRQTAYRIAHNYTPEPNDFDSAKLLTAPTNDEWWYVQLYEDPVNNELVHFSLRHHGSEPGPGVDRSGYYWFANLKTGTVYGKNGEIGNLHTGEGLPISDLDTLWKIQTQFTEDTEEPLVRISSILARGDTRTKTAILPYTERDGNGDNWLKLASITGGTVKTKDFNIQLGYHYLGAFENHGVISIVYTDSSNNVKMIQSHDRFYTHEIKDLDTVADIANMVAARGLNNDIPAVYDVDSLTNPQLTYVKEDD